MGCPGCGKTTEALTLDGHYGRRLEIDVCNGCSGLWLDGSESHQLTAGATLTLFRRFADASRAQPATLQPRKACPRCELRLISAVDRQRGTSFEVFTCPRGHGRFLTPLAFLRAKNFVRDLRPDEIAKLRQHVTQVTCTGCGAAVDVRTKAACGHCGAAIAILDPEQVAKTAAQLVEKQADATQVDPAWPMRAVQERLRTARLFAALDQRSSSTSFDDLIEVGWASLQKLWPSHGL